MHLFLISDGCYSGTGFGEELKNLAFRWAQQGHEVTWLDLQHMGSPATAYDTDFPDIPHKGSKVRRLGNWGNPRSFGSEVFIRHYEEYCPDIVLLLGDPYLMQSYARLKMQVGFPLIFYVTLDGLPIQPDWIPLLQVPNVLVTITEWARQEYRKFGLEPTTIHHGINWLWWQTTPENKLKVREKYGIDPETIVYISWDTNQHRKRLDALLRCWKQFRPETKNTKLILYTDWNCYSDDTEVLTRGGWKLFKDVTYSDQIATLNPKIDKLEYYHPNNIIKYKFAGKMFRQRGKSIDVLVTPNHRLWMRTYGNDDFSEFKFVEARKSPKKVKYKRDVKIWRGSEPQYFILPCVERNYPFGKEVVEEKWIKMDDWLRFFGIWIAEGSTSHPSKGNYLIRVAQKNKAKKQTIGEWMNKLPFHIKEIKNGFRIYSKQLWSYLKPFGKAKEKYIPKNIKELSRKQLKILFDAMMLGDGTSNTGHGMVYSTASKRLADDVQEIALKIGFAGTISKSYSNKNGKRFGIYRISISSIRNLTPQLNFPKEGRSWVDYNNMVYCVEVHNHIIYVRRNGRACWCGNCRLGWDIDEHLIKQYDIPRETILSPKDLTGHPKLWELAEPIEKVKEIAMLGDVYVSTTSGEGFGETLLQSQALGMPVIVTKYSACPEVVGNAGVLVPCYRGRAGRFRWHDSCRSVEGGIVNEGLFTKALNTMYTNKEYRTNLGKLGRLHSKMFDYDEVIIPMWNSLLSQINPDILMMRETLKL